MNPNSMGGTQNMVALDGPGRRHPDRDPRRHPLRLAFGGATLIVGPAVSTGAWHHVAYTYDGAGDQS